MGLFDKWNLFNKRKVTENSPEEAIDKKFSYVKRTKVDISKWRNAIKRVENPTLNRYNDLVEVYTEINDDADVTAQKQTRFNFILSKDYNIVDNEGNIDEYANNLFKKDWFDDFTLYTLQSIMWGYSFIQLGDENIETNDIEGCTLLPRQNCNPQHKVFLRTPTEAPEEGISILDDENKNYVLCVSDSKDEDYKGLYSKIAPYFIFLRESTIQFANYNIRFGSGQFAGYTDSADEEYRNNFREFLSNASASTIALLSKDDRIEILQAGSGNSQVFTELMRECRESISKIILGSSTPLGSEKSFVGSANITFSIANMYSERDIKFVQRIVNNDLIPKLINLGFTYLQGKKIQFSKEDQTSDPTSEKQFIIQLLQLGKNIPDEYITEKFGIPLGSPTVATELPTASTSGLAA